MYTKKNHSIFTNTCMHIFYSLFHSSNVQNVSCLLPCRLDMQGKDIREEPKGIVFLSKLLLLFEFCHLCFFSKPKVAVTQTGTMLTIQSECSNCGETFTWKSQPDLLGRFPAGNLLLSFAVLCAGTSIRKVLLVFRHMVCWFIMNQLTITTKDTSLSHL